MSFSSFEAGAGSSAGAAFYPLRTMVRDEFQRALDAELARWLNRESDDVGLDVERDESEDELQRWLSSDDSPLLLRNIPDHVLDPSESLRAISERVDGLIRSLNFSGEEVTGVASHHRASELRARLTTFAELDGERILSTPRRRGTPKGETRTHYVSLISPDRDIPNREFKQLVLAIICERWPECRVIAYIHRDTDNTHLHIWISAEQIDNRKISIGEEKQPDGRVVDKYRSIDEDVALAFSRFFNEPAIYEEHIAKKQEWNNWKERFKESQRTNERPPVMPFRARHDFDYVAENIAIARREQNDGGNGQRARWKAAPVPRTRSQMGSLELWGKTVHLEARVAYRRELLESLDAWKPSIEYPTEGVRRDFERKLVEAEHAHAEYKDALEKTIANRARKGYPELAYALHNRRQIEEMRQIAELTFNAELLRYVNAYTILDKSIERESVSREIADKWRDQLVAQIEVIERTQQLKSVVQDNLRPLLTTQSEDEQSKIIRHSFNTDLEIVNGWLHGNWTAQQMNDSLVCFDEDHCRYQAGRYLKACEYLAATRDVLEAYRQGAEEIITRPSLDEAQHARINTLLETDGDLSNREEDSFLKEIAVYAKSEAEPDGKTFVKLIESSLSGNKNINGKHLRNIDEPENFGVLNPHDEQLMATLMGATKLKEAEALALAIQGISADNFAQIQIEVSEHRNMMELAERVHAAAGKTNLPPALMVEDERQELERHQQFISQRIEHYPEWTEQQIEHIGKCAHAVLPEDKEKLDHALRQSTIDLEKAKLSERILNVNQQLAISTRFFTAKAYQTEGLGGLLDQERFEEKVNNLTVRYFEVIEAGGCTPEQLRIDEFELKERASRALTESLVRYEREERETHNLLRLEAKLMLADALHGVSIANRERFDNHAYFIQWGYKAGDSQEFLSLAEGRVDLAQQDDMARRRVAEAVVPHLVHSIQQVHAELAAEEEQRSRDANEAGMVYETALRGRGKSVPENLLPIFASEELKQLEECAVITRDVQLIGIINQIEENEHGKEHAVRRNLGRAIAAIVSEGKEHSLPEIYENPINLEDHPALPPHMQAELSTALHTHLTARAEERSSVNEYRTSLEHIAAEQVRSFRNSEGRELVPLLSVAEGKAVLNFQRRDGALQLLVLENNLRGAEVYDLNYKNRSGYAPGMENRTPSFKEWSARSMASANYTFGLDHIRYMSVKNLPSYRGVQNEIEREVDRVRERSRPSRGR